MLLETDILDKIEEVDVVCAPTRHRGYVPLGDYL